MGRANGDGDVVKQLEEDGETVGSLGCCANATAQCSCRALAADVFEHLCVIVHLLTLTIVLTSVVVISTRSALIMISPFE